MNKYELKDKERQALLEQCFPDFSEAFQIAARNQIFSGKELIKVSANNCFWSVTFYKDEIQLSNQYDPNDWNEYSRVKPPEGIPMRVECKNMKTCLVFRKGKWVYPSGEPFENYEFQFPVERFRPWE